MRKWLLIGFLSCVLLALPAAADTIHYTLSGSLGTLTFSLPVNPTVTASSPGDSFEIDNVSTSAGLDTFVFFSSASGGALAESLLGYNLFGAQIYSGLESNPTMLTGTFTLDQGTGVPVTLTATEAVPEPASLLLLGTGLLGVANRLRRKNH